MPSTPRILHCHSISLGCPKNRVDTEEILGRLPGVRIVPADTPEDADFVFINTCAFIGPAVEESVRTIAQIIADCEDEAQKPLLVVAGCLVGRFGADSMAPDLPEVDLWLDNRQSDTWLPRLAAALGLASPPQNPAGRLLSTGPSYAWLKISDGCNHACSFCTIPGIRGPLRSTPKKEVTAEARALLDSGVRELALVAQDVTAWGTDLGERHGLRSLLDELLPLPGLARLRLLYLYPAGLTPELLAYLREAGEPLVPYFDIPIQHAAPNVLSRMGRPFAQNPRRVIERVRSVFPEAVLRTTLITGFPGETEADFAQLMNFIQEIRFQHLGVFAYQAEEGTPAANMPDQIEGAIGNARRDALMQVQADISAEWLAVFANERLSVLVDAPHPDWPCLHTGRTWFQAPEIDGLTYISGPDVHPGALVEADIVECRDYDLVALA